MTTAILGVIGLNVGQHLSVSNLLVSGNESTREAQLFEQQFGSSVSAPILPPGTGGLARPRGSVLARSLTNISGSRPSRWDQNAGLYVSQSAAIAAGSVPPMTKPKYRPPGSRRDPARPPPRARN
ncbi:MAG: hypothetical protein M3065_00725 [Actinomycetota bacterium]|nr:hypothetical protein [Actinomycetota bacterium]